jgi:hypothetical protein
MEMATPNATSLRSLPRSMRSWRPHQIAVPGETITNSGLETPSPRRPHLFHHLTSIKSVETSVSAHLTPSLNSSTEKFSSLSDTACESTSASTGEAVRPTVILGPHELPNASSSSSSRPPQLTCTELSSKFHLGVTVSTKLTSKVTRLTSVEHEDTPHVQAIDMRKRAAASESTSSPQSAKAKSRKNKKSKQDKQDPQNSDA